MHTKAEYTALIRSVLPTVHPGARLDVAIYEAIKRLIEEDVAEEGRAAYRSGHVDGWVLRQSDRDSTPYIDA